MRSDLLDEWLSALESGDYDQTKGRLGEYSDDGGKDSFCCLGVLCDIGLDHDDAPIGLTANPHEFMVNSPSSGYACTDVPPELFTQWSGHNTGGFKLNWDYSFEIVENDSDNFYDYDKDTYREPFDDRGVYVNMYLPHLNDGGFTFAQIADVIRWAEPRSDS